MSSPSLTGPPPRVRQTPAKPRITINIPPQHGHPANSPYLSTAPHTAHSSTVPAGAPQWPLYENPFTGANMYKQFEGFCDFTMASAKSGLGFGEKFAFAIYEKFSTWSRKWFTHIFLFLCIFLYSLAGAYIFMAVEGPPQKQAFDDFLTIKTDFSKNLYVLAQSRHAKNLTNWQSEVEKQMKPFMQSVTNLFKKGYYDRPQTSPSAQWNNTWGAMFYCGTVFTTIDVLAILGAPVVGDNKIKRELVLTDRSKECILLTLWGSDHKSFESAGNSVIVHLILMAPDPLILEKYTILK